MGWQEDARCRIVSTIAPETLTLLEAALDPSAIEKNCGCRVIKHPDCCALCRVNNDCERVPVHFNCRCVREFECF